MYFIYRNEHPRARNVIYKIYDVQHQSFLDYFWN